MTINQLIEKLEAARLLADAGGDAKVKVSTQIGTRGTTCNPYWLKPVRVKAYEAEVSIEVGDWN